MFSIVFFLILSQNVFFSNALKNAISPDNKGDQFEEVISTVHTPHDPGPLKPLLPENYPLMLRDVIVPTDPPAPPVRMCAEWEPAVSVLIRYPVGLPWDLISELAQDLHITCLASNVSSAQDAFSSHGISLSDVTFVSTQTNSIWTRDYGPWTVFDGSDSVGISDHVYNRRYTHGRIDDDESNWDLAPALGVKLWKTLLVHTGGNMMCDGHGIAMSSDNVYFDDNPSLSVDSVNSLMLAYWGIHTYYTFSDPLGSYINHIDCYAKFLSETKVALIYNGVDDPYLNQIAGQISSLTNCYGENYEVVRLNCPDNLNAAYINSLILNGKVYVPLTGDQTHDTAALNFFEREMPGYDAVGFQYTDFQPTDAIHCRTMAIFDPGMLYIDHNPYIDTADLRVKALVHPYSGAGVKTDSVFFVWKISSETQFTNYEVMNKVPGFEDSFTIFLPQPVGESLMTINYFIQATDSSGRTQKDPYTAPSGYYTVTYEIQNTVQEEFPSVNTPFVQFRSDLTAGVLKVEFSIPWKTDVYIGVFDVAGREICRLSDGLFEAGIHFVTYDVKNISKGSPLSAGNYFVFARIGDETFAGKIYLIDPRQGWQR